MTYREPPEGWYTFGTHVDVTSGKLDFSSELDEDGFPLWERKSRRSEYADIADLLRRWEVADGNIGRFDRGLHLLGHLARGGTLEEYGEPDA